MVDGKPTSKQTMRAPLNGKLRDAQNRLRRARRETELTNTGTWSVASRNRGLLRF